MTRRPPPSPWRCLLVALAVALAVAVPWTPLPGADLRPDAGRDFTAAQIAREVAFHDALRPASYASLALGLVVVAGARPDPAGRAGWSRAVARPLGGGWVWQVLLGTLARRPSSCRLVTLPLRARGETVLRDVRAVDADLGRVGGRRRPRACWSTRR